ncbi:MAG: hypothetical protein Q9170_000653 [Blastenia crenularia]
MSVSQENRQDDGPKTASELATEMLRGDLRINDINRIFSLYLSSSGKVFDLLVGGNQYARYGQNVSRSKCTSKLVVGAYKGTSQLADCKVAMKSVRGGLSGVRKEVMDTFRGDRWAAIQLMAEAILSAQAALEHDVRANATSPDSEELKWLAVVKILKSTTDDTAETKASAVQDNNPPLKASDLGPKFLPLEAIRRYRSVVKKLPDRDWDSRVDLRRMKRSARFETRILCALYVDASLCCTPMHCIMVEEPVPWAELSDMTSVSDDNESSNG